MVCTWTTELIILKTQRHFFRHRQASLQLIQLVNRAKLSTYLQLLGLIYRLHCPWRNLGQLALVQRVW